MFFSVFFSFTLILPYNFCFMPQMQAQCTTKAAKVQMEQMQKSSCPGPNPLAKTVAF